MVRQQPLQYSRQLRSGRPSLRGQLPVRFRWSHPTGRCRATASSRHFEVRKASLRAVPPGRLALFGYSCSQGVWRRSADSGWIIPPSRAGLCGMPRKQTNSSTPVSPGRFRRVDETYIRLYRAIDSRGDTIDFMISPRRDLAAAKQFLRLALYRSGVRLRVINFDGHPAYAHAIADLKQCGELGRRCRCRPTPYLNNIIAQDHRFIKKRIAASLCFRSVGGALNTIAGYEAMHMIRKGQVRWLEKGDVICQIHLSFNSSASQLSAARRQPNSLPLFLFATEPCPRRQPSKQSSSKSALQASVGGIL